MNSTQVFPLRIVGNSLYLRVPADLRRGKKLEPGDFLILDLNKVGIVRKADFLNFAEVAPRLEEVEPQNTV